MKNPVIWLLILVIVLVVGLGIYQITQNKKGATPKVLDPADSAKSETVTE